MIKVVAEIDKPNVEKLLLLVQREFPELDMIDLQMLLGRASGTLQEALGDDSTISLALSGSNGLSLLHPKPADTASPDCPPAEDPPCS
jgi:hypothetical protein